MPNTGDLVGTWSTGALNPNFEAIDGYQAGVAAISASGAITLTSPSGFTATPSAGPTQSQNALIRLSGALTGNVTVTFPLPGYYIIENLCTNNNSYYVQLLSSGAGNAIGAVPGKKCHVFNDGTNMDYVNMPDPGTAYDLHGATTLPLWMTACTMAPYLIKDGSQYTTTSYPALFALLGYQFGGSGSNFNVPDERARMRLAYDPNGTGRVNSTVNASTMGSAGGAQALNAASQIPAVTPTFSGTTHTWNSNQGNILQSINAQVSGGSSASYAASGSGNISVTVTPSGTISTIGSSSPTQALPPTIVSFLPLIKT